MAAVELKRRPTNLSLREDLVQAAREMEINISQVAEAALTLAVRKAAAERWLAENREAIEAYNDRVDRQGLFNEGLRRL